jgi:hypothetical protein
MEFFKKMRVFKRHGTRGYALAIVIMLIPVIYILANTIIAKSIVHYRAAVHDDGTQKAFYIAEGGEAVASLLLASNNYSRFTHTSDLIPESVDERLIILDELANVIEIDEEGWYCWSWKPGDTNRSFTGTDRAESFKFRIYPDENDETRWTIEVEGVYDGSFVKKIQVIEALEAGFPYVLFGAEDLSEFTRGTAQVVHGKVHANGNLFIRPDNSTVTIHSDSVTAAGKIMRHIDAWDRVHTSGDVFIRSDDTGSLAEMQGSNNPSVAFSSLHSNWLNTAGGALSRWNGRVLDGSLGAKKIALPPLESFVEGGYYERHAGIIIDSATDAGATDDIVHDRTLYNAAENRYENYKEIDISRITSYPGYSPLPVNLGGGLLIYSKVPIRIINAEVLPVKMTIVCNANIYLQGDFNKLVGTKESQKAYLDEIIDADQHGQLSILNHHDYITKKPAALVSSQRIYRLSKGYNDAENFKGAALNTAVEPATYENNIHNVFDFESSDFLSLSEEAQNLVREIREDDDVMEINSILVDGIPTVNERNWVKTWNNMANPHYTGTWVPALANSDALLEEWTGARTIRKRGSIIHLSNSPMAKMDNSNAGPGVAGWVIRSHYKPPFRDYRYDNDLLNPTLQPPMFLKLARRLMWKTVSDF